MPAPDTGRAQPKDEVLDQLAEAANVAQFVSFAPGDQLIQRFCRLHGRPPNQPFTTPEEAVEALLRTSESGSVNVRSFHGGDSKGGPFKYGLHDCEEALA